MFFPVRPMKIFVTARHHVRSDVLVAVPVCIGLSRRHKEDRGSAVRVEKPTRGDLVEIVSASGTIMPKTKVSISARVSALIQEIPYDEGQEVTRGDPAANAADSAVGAGAAGRQGLAVGIADGGVARGNRRRRRSRSPGRGWWPRAARLTGCASPSRTPGAPCSGRRSCSRTITSASRRATRPNARWTSSRPTSPRRKPRSRRTI